MIKKIIKHNSDSYNVILEEPTKLTNEEKEEGVKEDIYFKIFIIGDNHNYMFGVNFNSRKETIKNNKIPIFKSQSKQALEYLYNMINEENISMFNLINTTYTIDDSVFNLNYQKYDNTIQHYSEFLVLMEHIAKKDNVYSYLINNLNDLFFQSDLHPEINTLNIITRFIDYNFPKEEIVHLFKKAITLKNQIDLDYMLNPHMIEAFSYVDTEEFNTLENWEKVIFYRYCVFFMDINFGKEKKYNRNLLVTNNIPLSFLPGIFVTALCTLKKQNKSILPAVNKINNIEPDINDFSLILEYIVDNITIYSSQEKIEYDTKELFYLINPDAYHSGNYNYSSIKNFKPLLMKILTLYVSLFHTKQENADMGIILMINVFVSY